MIDKKSIFESLDKFIDAVASGDTEAERAAIKDVITPKSKTVLEFIGDSAIKLDGDDVLVQGKKVGQVKSDADDVEGGINFVSAEGNFSKEFDSIEDLYKFIAQRYNVKEGALQLTEADLAEGRVEDAVGKTPAGKAARLARWASVRKAAPGDSTPGDYEAGDEKVYVDPVKGGKKAAKGAEKDLETDSQYDSHDVRPKHNN